MALLAAPPCTARCTGLHRSLHRSLHQLAPPVTPPVTPPAARCMRAAAYCQRRSRRHTLRATELQGERPNTLHKKIIISVLDHGGVGTPVTRVRRAAARGQLGLHVLALDRARQAHTTPWRGRHTQAHTPDHGMDGVVPTRPPIAAAWWATSKRGEASVPAHALVRRVAGAARQDTSWRVCVARCRRCIPHDKGHGCAPSCPHNGVHIDIKL